MEFWGTGNDSHAVLPEPKKPTQIEPECYQTQEGYMHSIAISLKRIADALENK